MPTRTARTAWTGTLEQGSGQVELTSSQIATYDVSFPKRAAENADGTTSPEELIAAAHAGCFSMALSNALAQAGHTAMSVKTSATVHLDKGAEGFGIAKIDLDTVGDVPGIDEAEFLKYAEGAKANCPVSKALAAVEITVSARLA